MRLLIPLVVLELTLSACDKNTREFGTPAAQESHEYHESHGTGTAADPHAGIGSFASPSEAAEGVANDGHDVPLRAEGQSSVVEMRRDLARLPEGELRERFDHGFRACFTSDSSKRDYPAAAREFEAILDAEPEFGPAWRGLGYARFNIGFDVDGAMQAYLKAVEVDPEYGEAHYALSFMYVMSDIEKGRPHFERALALGVADERRLGEQFYH